MKSLLRKKRKHIPVSIEPIGTTCPSLQNAEISAATAGAQRGHDYCDSFRVNSARIVFGLFELSGHRRQPSKVFPILQDIFRTASTPLLSSPEINETEALSKLCLQLNRSIIKAAGTAHPCPAFVGCYNEDVGILSYFNAGHTPGLVKHALDISELGATGLPLGLFSHGMNEASVIALEPGAAVVVVSRGVVATTSNGEEFGLRGVTSALHSSRAASAHGLCISILHAAQNYSSASTTEQSLTALALVRNGT
jgi:serine phosphatase RsbU (regulator of sigma subunit)